MMELINDIKSLSSISGATYLAIGVFDGLHKGHQEVIGCAVDAAANAGGIAVVITFDPHPRAALSSGPVPRLLTSTRHKMVLLERLGVDQVLLIHFDEPFSRIPADEFVAQLASACQDLRQITVGSDWSFGYKRSGDLELLSRLGDELGFDAVGVPSVRAEGQVISSTLIRQAVEKGDFSIVEGLLGRKYTVLGTVVEGKRLGRTIGYPTANLSVHNEKLPPSGVYAVRVALDSGKGDRHIGLANLGHRPTVEGEQGLRLLEVYLLDFEQEIYGEDLEITFVKFLREEQKFDGLEELKTQIAADEMQVRQLELQA
ncbi:MAG: bifunctional riboflavin kinase/FAD synthetase [Verrucomicrobia bacterium]|nr:bifunctional riboflavin kinase/FAD synthetase [Verrucomicrobiota bacterium]